MTELPHKVYPSYREIIPLGQYIVVKPEKVEEKTPGGVYIPDKTREQQELSGVKATMVALGKEAFSEYMKGTPIPEPGDRIITARYVALKIECEEGVYHLCKDSDVIAVIKGD